MKAELAGDSGLSSGRDCRKTIWSPAAIMNPLDLRPDFRKMGPDTISAEADYTGDGGTTLGAVPAGAHANAEYSFADAGHVPVLKRVSMLMDQPSKISRSKIQISGFRCQGSGVRKRET